MSEQKKRHRWAPWAEAPDRDDLRACLNDCDILRRNFGKTRYEYVRLSSGKFVANYKRSWPAPPCQPPLQQEDRHGRPQVNLPTEEDVLAILVLHAVLEGVWGKAEWQDFEAASRDMNDRWPSAAREIATHRRRRAPGTTAEAAIADSERRLAWEEARDEVVDAARAWGESVFAGDGGDKGAILSAVCRLESAEMGLGALEGK